MIILDLKRENLIQNINQETKITVDQELHLKRLVVQSYPHLIRTMRISMKNNTVTHSMTNVVIITVMMIIVLQIPNQTVTTQNLKDPSNLVNLTVNTKRKSLRAVESLDLNL